MMEQLLTKEVTEELDKMIRRIAYSKKNTIMMETEDVVAELWIKCLEIINKKGEIDYNYLASACFHGIVDLVRKSVKEEHLPYDNSEFDRCVSIDQYYSSSGEASETHVYVYASTVNHKRFQKAEERMEVEEILSLFDEENEIKERIFIETWMKILGIKETEDVSDLPEKAYDKYIAVDLLGYASSGSCGYGRLKKRVREKLIANGYKLL